MNSECKLEHLGSYHAWSFKMGDLPLIRGKFHGENDEHDEWTRHFHAFSVFIAGWLHFLPNIRVPVFHTSEVWNHQLWEIFAGELQLMEVIRAASDLPRCKNNANKNWKKLDEKTTAQNKNDGKLQKLMTHDKQILDFQCLQAQDFLILLYFF